METIAKHEVKELNWPERTFITKRDTVSFDQLKDFFGKNYGAIYTEIQKAGFEANEPPCAIYYSVDEVKKVTDLAAAVPVKRSTPELKGFKKTTIPKSRVVSTTHIGSYESMMPAYEALEKYLKEHSLNRELVIEEYFSDPEVEKDPDKWKTNIYFLVK